MQYSYLYLLLIAISLVILSIILLIKKDFRVIVLHFCIAGIIHHFDLVVTVIYPGYRFLPHLHENIWFDTVMGAFISDLFIVPAVAVLIAVFDIGLIGMAAFAIFFMGIEYLFVYTGIYYHFWWKTIYTGIGLMVYFTIGKYFWKKILNPNPVGIIHLLILYLCYTMIRSPLNVVLVAYFAKYFWHPGWYLDPIRDHMVMGAIHLYLISFIAAVMVWPRTNTIFRVLGLPVMYAIDWILFKLGILNFPSNWTLINFMLMHILVLAIIAIFNYFVLSSSQLTKNIPFSYVRNKKLKFR